MNKPYTLQIGDGKSGNKSLLTVQHNSYLSASTSKLKIAEKSPPPVSAEKFARKLSVKEAKKFSNEANEANGAFGAGDSVKLSRKAPKLNRLATEHKFGYRIFFFFFQFWYTFFLFCPQFFEGFSSKFQKTKISRKTLKFEKILAILDLGDDKNFFLISKSYFSSNYFKFFSTCLIFCLNFLAG